MKKLNLILIMLSVGLFGVIVFIKLNPETIQKTKEIKITKYTSTKTSREIEIEKFNAQEEKDGEDLFISGWIPDWDIPDGFETLKNQNFNSISPVWFWVNDDGSLQLTTYTNSQEFIAYTKENNIELIPTITLFDAEILNKVLNSPENFERHVEDIVTNVIKNDYDGIDLDYESIYLQDKEEFFELLETLKIRLEEKNKKLVFTAMPKWGDTFTYFSLPQTRLVQDYKRISDIVDEFRIMTYELHGRNGEKIGPIAPIMWLDQVIQYALAQGVPREKILLGIHTYAYDFPSREIIGEIYDEETKNFVWSRSVEPYGTGALFPDGIDNLLNNYGMTEQYNQEWEEAIGRYTFDGKERIVIYPTQKSIDARKDLARKYSLKGVVYWRIGDDENITY